MQPSKFCLLIALFLSISFLSAAGIEKYTDRSTFLANLDPTTLSFDDQIAGSYPNPLIISGVSFFDTGGAPFGLIDPNDPLLGVHGFPGTNIIQDGFSATFPAGTNAVGFDLASFPQAVFLLGEVTFTVFLSNGGSFSPRFPTGVVFPAKKFYGVISSETEITGITVNARNSGLDNFTIGRSPLTTLIPQVDVNVIRVNEPVRESANIGDIVVPDSQRIILNGGASFLLLPSPEGRSSAISFGTQGGGGFEEVPISAAFLGATNFNDPNPLSFSQGLNIAVTQGTNNGIFYTTPDGEFAAGASNGINYVRVDQDRNGVFETVVKMDFGSDSNFEDDQILCYAYNSVGENLDVETAFNTITQPIVNLELDSESGKIGISFTGILQVSDNLDDWETLDPQPQSPTSFDLDSTPMFFQTIAAPQ